MILLNQTFQNRLCRGYMRNKLHYFIKLFDVRLK